MIFGRMLISSQMNGWMRAPLGPGSAIKMMLRNAHKPHTAVLHVRVAP